MHNIHTNRISDGGTSAALDNDAVKRIDAKVKEAQTKRASKRDKKTAIKKTANKKPDTVKEKEHIIKVASINDIPPDFERIGTGFYRNSHHLWQLTPTDNGFTLVRKRGEDHVLGYDPEPVSKNAEIADRFGNAIKTGSRVAIPHRGKVASGTVVIIQPGTLDVGLDSGEQIGVPPDMCELLEEKATDTPVENNEFEPEVEPTSKEAQTEQTQPQYTPTPEPAVPPTVPPSTESKWRTQRQMTFPTERLEAMKKESQLFADLLNNQGRLYIVAANNPEGWYEVELREGGENPQFSITPLTIKASKEVIEDWSGLLQFEQTTGGYQSISAIPKTSNKKHDREIALIAKQIIESIGMPDMKSWKEYWGDLGQRVGARKPLTPEQKERRKQRRKERKQERAGLPPGTPVPPKSGAVDEDVDEVAEYKEKLRLYEQLIDEIEYILRDETIREDEVRLADELERTLQEYHEQREEMNIAQEEEIEEDLSIEVPPSDEEEAVAETPKISKITVSMEEL